MIDFNDMKRRQEEGQKLVDSLQEMEFEVLQHYCSLATEALMKMSSKANYPADKLVINALKVGIGLGLRLDIADGEIQGRT